MLVHIDPSSEGRFGGTRNGEWYITKLSHLRTTIALPKLLSCALLRILQVVGREDKMHNIILITFEEHGAFRKTVESVELS